MKNIVNFRALFFCFIAFCFAILFSAYLIKGQAIYIVFFSLVLLGLLFLALWRKKLLQIALIFLFLSLGIGSYFMGVGKFNNARIFAESQTISAQVQAVTNHTNSQSLVLNNIKINGEKQNFKISLFIVNGNLKLGDKITFEGLLENVQLFDLGKFSSFLYNNNILYLSSINSSAVLSAENSTLSFRDTIKQNTLNKFLENMPEDEARVLYGAMFGENTGIDSDIYTSFSKSGIIHILSVSGMHMVIVVAMLNAALKRTKLNKKVRLIIFAIGILFYSYLCSFNITVVRSAIMSLALLFGGTFGKRYDMLSAVGLSGLFILVLKPLSVFDIGFQLSFLSVIMIALFSKPLTNFFVRLKFPKTLATALALSLSVQIGISPLLLKYFSEASMIAIFSNIIIAPIFELSFIIAFVFNILTIFLPFLNFIFALNSYLVSLTIKLSLVFSKLDWLILKTPPLNDIATALFLTSLFVLSGYVMLRKWQKISILSALLIISLIFGGLNTLPAKNDGLAIYYINDYYSTSVLISSNNNNLLVTDFGNEDRLIKYFQIAKVKKIDQIVLTENLNELQNDALATLVKNYKVANVYEQGIAFENEFAIATYFSIFPNEKILTIKSYGHNILFMPKAQLSNFQLEIASDLSRNNNTNVVISPHKILSLPQMLYADIQIFNDGARTVENSFLNLNNCLFSVKNGKLMSVRSLN